MQQKIDKNKFLLFLKDLFNEKEHTDSFRISSEEEQKNGIDIFSRTLKIAIHFRVEEFNKNEKIVFNSLMKNLKGIIEKTKFSTHEFEKFIIISTYKNDDLIFEYIQLLKANNKYPFEIDYWGWDTVSEYLDKYEHLLHKNKLSETYKHKLITEIPSIKSQQIYGIDEILKEIDEKLFVNEKKSMPVVLYNVIKGIGKSTTAISYALTSKYQKKYKHIAYINCIQDIKLSFVKAFDNDKFDFKYKNRFAIYENFNFLFAQLNKIKGEKLLIIDNITEHNQITEISEYLTQLNWKIIITSHYKFFNFNNVKINTLPKNNAKKLLEFFYKDKENEKTIEKLLLKINYHPFLTQFLAKNIKTNKKLTINKLYKILLEKDTKIHHLKKYILFDAPQNEIDWQKQILKYIIGIYEYQLSELNRNEKKYLTSLCCFPDKRFTFDEIIDILDLDKREENNFSNIIVDLIAKNWIEVDKNMLYIQPYVKNILHKKLKPNIKKIQKIIKNLIEKLHYDLNNSIIDFTHIIYSEELLKNLYNDSRLSSTLAYNLALQYENMGNLSKSQEHYLFAAYINEQYYEETEPDAKLTENLSQIFYKTHNLQKALYYGHLTLDIRKQEFDENSPIIAQTYRAIALIYDKMEKYEKAIEYIDNSLDIFQEIYEEENEELLNTKTIHNYLSKQYNEAERKRNKRYWFNKYF